LEDGAILVSATLVGSNAQTGPGGVKAATNTGVWAFAGGQPSVPLVQKGAITTVAGKKRVASYLMLNPVNASPGQFRFQSGQDGSDYAARVTYTDGTQAILGLQTVASGAAPAALPKTRFQSFGTPALGRTDANSLTYRAALKIGIGGVTAANDTGIFTGPGELVARAGQLAPSTARARFKSFLDPIGNDDTEVAFIARLTGKGVTAASNEAIFFQPHDLTSDARALTLVAQTGGAAPGLPGAVFGDFISLALPNLAGTQRLYFVAKLALPSAGQPNPLNLNSRNNTGLWARDSAGNVQLLLRIGTALQVAGGSTKTLRAFTILSAVPGSTGQARSFNDNGALVYNASFTDGSQAILITQVP
jgi:hypothetical protein